MYFSLSPLSVCVCVLRLLLTTKKNTKECIGEKKIKTTENREQERTNTESLWKQGKK